MLIDKYLPAYHFHEFHSVEICGPADGIYQKVLQTDFSYSALITFLFRLRGMPQGLYTIEHLTRMGFIRLGEESGQEIVYGVVTVSPIFHTCRPIVASSGFISAIDPGIIKAVINFRLKEKDQQRQIICTETRVWCGSNRLKKKFRYYWFFVKPFSQLIRKAMLRTIKKQISF